MKTRYCMSKPVQELPIDLAVLKSANEFYWQCSTSVSCPFKLSPADYLTYAESDLVDGAPRGYLNALHNSKRAITCAVDCILWNFGLASRLRTNFPAKIEVIRNMGLLSPRIVGKLVRSRNLLEHEYTTVTSGEAEDAVDIATLFSASLQPFAMTRYEDFLFVNEREGYEGGLDWQYKTSNGRIIRQIGKDHTAASPAGISFEVYRVIDPKLDAEHRGVCQRLRARRLSASSLAERGVIDVGYGLIDAKHSSFLDLLRCLVLSIKASWTW